MEGNRQGIEVTERGDVALSAEQTRPGPVFMPQVDIFEIPEVITVMADLPGVTADDLSVDLEDGVLTIRGSVDPPEKDPEESLVREYDTGSFYRQFKLAQTIDQAAISAKLSDGVLRLVLPKVEAAKPRQITIQT
jgi:HSP20 family molecular chaperone IbpA